MLGNEKKKCSIFLFAVFVVVKSSRKLAMSQTNSLLYWGKGSSRWKRRILYKNINHLFCALLLVHFEKHSVDTTKKEEHALATICPAFTTDTNHKGPLTFAKPATAKGFL